MERKKVYELDKICRVCISERKDMRPLFSEKVAEMLMECASVSIENTEGWPDKICVQCVHAVSRCHAFKTLVERSDRELREYIKSLTVRLVIEESTSTTADVKLHQQQNQAAKLLQKQHKILEKQQLMQQQLLQKKKTSARTRKLQRQSRKQQQLQIREQQQQQLLQSQLDQSVPEPIAIHGALTAPASRPQLQQQQHQVQQSHQPQQQQIAIPATATLPHQIVLPNGQIITTAQIVTHAGPPQIAQIISTAQGSGISTASPAPQQHNPQQHNPQQHNPQQHTPQQQQSQYTPQLIQTSSGQTLQIIQQPNGQQTLQLVQLMPQRAIGGSTGTVVLTTEDGTAHIVDDEALMEQSEQHLIDDDDGNAGDDDDQKQISETIVIEEEQLQHQQLLATPRHPHHQDVIHHASIMDDELSQDDAQELEYLDDITITTTTTGAHVHHHQDLHHQHGINHDDGSQQHFLHDDDIIEEIQMEEEMLEDEDSNGVMHVMDANGGEFISEDEDVTQTQHIISDGCDVQLQYGVIESGNDDVDDDVSEVLQVACAEGNISDIMKQTTNGNTLNYSQCGGDVVSQARQNSEETSKKTARRVNSNTSKAAVVNSRQLAATASSIASAVADDDFEIDSKFICEFISQQTTALGSGRYVCNLCRQEFKQFKGLQNHMHLHSNWIRANCKKQPQCEICLKSFKGPGMLKMHMKTHQSAERTPTCNICGKIFKSKAILYRHRQTHQQRSYACGVENCRKTFSTMITLRAHTERKHPNDPQPKFKCGGCSTLFDDVEVLQTHVEMTGHGTSDGSGVATGVSNVAESTGGVNISSGAIVVVQA